MKALRNQTQLFGFPLHINVRGATLQQNKSRRSFIMRMNANSFERLHLPDIHLSKTACDRQELLCLSHVRYIIPCVPSCVLFCDKTCFGGQTGSSRKRHNDPDDVKSHVAWIGYECTQHVGSCSLSDLILMGVVERGPASGSVTLLQWTMRRRCRTTLDEAAVATYGRQ